MSQIYVQNDSAQFQDLFVKMYPELINEGEFKDTLITKNITFVMAEACNLRCTYCYECHKDHNKYMSKEVAKKAVDMMFDKNRMKKYLDVDVHKCLILDFIGGEPFLNVEVMDFIVDYFKYKATMENSIWAKHFMINVTTNGTLNHVKEVQDFIAKNRERLSISITIDGDKELHDACRIFPDGSGSYDIVYKNLKDAMERFGLKGTKVTFAPENIEKINTAIPHLFDIGLTDINANCVFEDVWEDHHAPIFYNELVKLADYMIDNKIYEHAYCSIFSDSIGHPMDKTDNRNWCGGDGQMLAIGTDGNLYPCIRFMKYSLANAPEIQLGTIDDGVKTAKDDKVLATLFSITRSSQSTDECFNCPVASGCAWCTGYNYDVFGTPNKRAIFICKMHKARVLATYYYFNKLYKSLGMGERFELHLSTEDIDFITNGKGLPLI